MTATANQPDPQAVLDFLGSLIGSVVGGVGEIVDVKPGRGSDVIVETSNNGTHTASGGTDDTGEGVIVFVPGGQASSAMNPLIVLGVLGAGAYLLTN